jgi:hypothetical protein
LHSAKTTPTLKQTHAPSLLSKVAGQKSAFCRMPLQPLSLADQDIRHQLVMHFALHAKGSWLLLCPFGFCARSFRTQLSQSSHSLPQPKVHPQPLSVLAREAAACVPDFRCHKVALICMPRENPALCDLSHSVPESAPSGGTRRCIRCHSFRFLASRTDCPQ